MKKLMINSIVWICCFTIFSANYLLAQNKIIDSTTDFNFDNIHISELIELRESFLYDDSATSKRILSSGNFEKSDSVVSCFVNKKLDRTIEFVESPVKGLPMKDAYNNKYVLVFRGKSKEFEKALEDFIRLQKLNEHLSVDEYKDEMFIGFFDIYQEVKFFVSLNKNDYCLVVL